MDYIFKKKIPPPKTNSESNIIEKNSMKIDDNEDEKKIIEDSKIYDLLDKDKCIDDKLLHNKFSKTIFNNNYSPMMFDVMNLCQNNKMDKNNMSFSNLQNIHSSSFASLNPTIPQNYYMFNRYNYESTPNLINNNMLPLSAMKGNPNSNSKKTLLSPPPVIMTDYSFPSLKNSNNQIFNQNNNEIINGNNNNINNTAVNKINNLNDNKQNYNIINNNSKKLRNSHNNKNLSEKSNNNEIQLFNKKRKRYIKNNKLVFILDENKKAPKNLETNGKNENNEKNKENTGSKVELNEENTEKVRKPRGSKYRGVSRNGNQWQVLIMVNKKKRYVGSFSKEEDAAHSYDKVALQNHGSKAKTNFDYSKKEVEEILAAPQLLKSC